MDSAKANWLKHLRKISKDVQIAERSLAHDDEANQKERRDQMKDTEEYFSRTQKRLQSFKTALEGIKERLNDICQGRSGADAIQPMLEAFERKLTDFKFSMRDDFVDLENELAASKVHEWLLASNGTTEEENVAIINKSKMISNNRLHLELGRQGKIGAIDKQLANMGGRSGGWDHRDQDAFIKVWTQLGCSPFIDCPDSKADFKPSTECNSSYQLKQHEDNSNEYEEYDDADSAEKESHRVDTSRCDSNEESPPSYEDSSNDNLRNNTNEDSGTGVMTLPAGQFSSLLRRLPVAVPGKLQAEFEEHIAWYLKFLQLNQQKKLLLSKWKEGKISDDKVNNIAINRALLIGERDGCKSDLSAKDMLKLAATEIEERANTRLKVSIWKQQKEREKEEFSLKNKDIASYENKMRDDKTKRRQEVTRLQLDQWRDAENLSLFALKRAADEASRLAKRAVSVDPAEVRRRQARDKESTRQRIEQKETYKRNTRPRSAIISETIVDTDFNARRDPSRLLAPTKASHSNALSGEHLDEAEIRRATQCAHSSNVAMSGRDLKFSGRAIPAWRRPPT